MFWSLKNVDPKTCSHAQYLYLQKNLTDLKAIEWGLATNGEKYINWLPTKRKKNTDYTDRKKTSRLPTWSNIVEIFVFRNKSFFYLSIISLFVKSILLDLFLAQGRSFSQLYFRPDVNDFKFQFQYLYNFLSLNYLFEIVMRTKSCTFDFRFSPGMFRRKLILYLHHLQSSVWIVQIVRLSFSSFSLEIQESTHSFPAQRVAIDRAYKTYCCSTFTACCLSISRAMREIIRVIVSFFRNG